MKKKTINRCFVTGMGLMITGLLFFDGIPADIYKGHLDFSSQETSVSTRERITEKQEIQKTLDMDIYDRIFSIRRGRRRNCSDKQAIPASINFGRDAADKILEILF